MTNGSDTYFQNCACARGRAWLLPLCSMESTNDAVECGGASVSEGVDGSLMKNVC